MDNNVTQQLATEIKKLKERDYTSYQNFYNQTSQRLYGVIWQIVQDQEAANTLMNELYTDIYASIGNELTDDTQFYAWAENKAQTMSNTYIATRVVAGNTEEDDDKKAAAAILANAGMGVAGNTSASGIAGNVPNGGASNVGMGTASGGNMNAGMRTVSSGQMNMNPSMNQNPMNVQTGSISKPPVNNVQTGSINKPPVNNVQTGSISKTPVNNVQTGSISKPPVNNAQTPGWNQPVNGGGSQTGAIKKPGMSVGAKIGLAIAAVAIVVGGVIGISSLTKDKDEEETTTEYVTTVSVVTTEAYTEEITTEAPVIDEKTQRYIAYFDEINIEAATAGVYYGETNIITGLQGVNLVDFNGDGNEQLVTVERSTPNNTNMAVGFSGSETIIVYDYNDGKVESVGKIYEDELWDTVFYAYQKNGNQTYLWLGFKDDNVGNEKYTSYEYVDGKMKKMHRYEKESNYNFYIDGEEVEEDGYISSKEQAMQGLDYYYLAIKDQSIYSAFSGYTGDPMYNYDFTPIKNLVTKTLIAKHEALKKLGEAAGNENVLTEKENLEFKVTASDGYINYIVESEEPNQYNEIFHIDDSYVWADTVDETTAISKDGKTLHFVKSEEVDVEVYFTVIDGTLILVGEKYNSYGGDDWTMQLSEPFCCWFTMDDYMVDQPYIGMVFDHPVSEGEFSANGNELMTR